MTKEYKEAKKAVLLNYGLMCSGIQDEMSNKVDFMRQFFVDCPDISSDLDLVNIVFKFRELCEAIKELDREVASHSDCLTV